MKRIYTILSVLLSVSSLLSSCSDDKPFSVAGPEDEPHILAPTFPDRENGALPTVSTINRDENFVMEITVTPADYVEVVWYFDGKERAQGKDIDLPLLAGTYEMHVVASTVEGKSTSRTGIVQVNPLDEDPQTTKKGFEDIIAPGVSSVLYGNNLELVKSMRVGDAAVSEMEFVAADGNSYIAYTVPAEAAEGNQRFVLIDENEVEYGGYVATVTSSAMITSGADRTTSNAAWTVTGINLDKVASLEFGGATITNFAEQTATTLQFTCPELEDGDYTLTGKMTDGNDVLFFQNAQTVTEVAVAVASQQILYSGHYYVSWDLADGDPNKMFNVISKDVFAATSAGATLSIHYSIKAEDEYHKMQTVTGWWSLLPGTGDVEFSETGVLELVLTQAMLDDIAEEDGFLCVGHGYYVDLVTLK